MLKIESDMDRFALARVRGAVGKFDRVRIKHLEGNRMAIVPLFHLRLENHMRPTLFGRQARILRMLGREFETLMNYPKH